ncbi:MAG: TolC family protein [Cyclobacteriaceae bacterium]
MYRLLIVAIILLNVGESYGQSEKYFTLKETIGQVLSQNWEIRKMKQNIGMSEAEMRQANSAFLPSLSLSETYVTTTDPMMAFGTKLGQSSIASTDFNPELLNNPDRISNFNTKVEFHQPLFNWDGLKYKEASKYNYQASLSDMEWLNDALILQTKKLYFQLHLVRKAKQVVEKARIAAESNYNTSKNLFDQGMITKADLMGTELYVTQLKSEELKADHDIINLNEMILELLGSDEQIIFIPADSIPSHTVNMNGITDDEVLSERPDLKSLSFKSRASESNYLAKKSSIIPRFNAFGYYNLNDTKLFGTQADNYLLGIQVKWDVFKGGKNLASTQQAKYQKQYAQINYEQKRSEANRNLLKLRNDFQLASEQVKLAELSVKQARELFKIRSDRYAEGLEKTSGVIADESNYLNKEIGLIQNQLNYLVLLFQLETELSQDLIK